MSVAARPTGTLAAALTIVADAVEPLGDELSSPERALALLESLGVGARQAAASLLGLRAGTLAVTAAAAELAAVLQAGDETSPAVVEKLLALADASRRLFAAISALPPRLRSDFAGDPELLAEIDLTRLARRLAEHVLVSYLRERRPVVYNLLLLVGALEVATAEASGERITAHAVRRFRGDLLRRLPGDPAGVAAEVYGWGTPGFAAGLVLERLHYLLFSLGLRVDRDDEPGTLGEAATARRLRLPLLAETGEEGAIELGLALVAAAATAADAGDAGLALEPYAAGGSSQSYELREGVTLGLEGGFDLEGGLALVLRPPLALDILTGTGSATGALGLTLDWTPADSSRLVLASQPDWFRLDVAGFRARLTAGVAAGKPPTLGLEVGAVDGAVVVGGSQADGFLASVLPRDGITTGFELTIGWAFGRGLYFGGSAGLEVTVPVQKSLLGILELQSVYLRAGAREGSASAVVAASFGVSLGPVKAAVDRLGVEAVLTFPPDGGNLGIAEAAVRFKPPSGAALSIDAGAVTGGGFLFFDAEREQYAGAIHLQFGAVALSAIGLVTTRLPDGSKGFSLLVIVTASGFAPVQLGFGFTLTGVGGLLGVNRTAAIDVLRAGIRQRALDAILFSKDDPVPRVAQIVSTLRSVFPPARDRYLFGPMAVIAWGTPTVLTLDVAIVLELPAPLRLIVLGRLRALLPVPDERVALVKLNMDVLGVIEFDRRQASLDATLYDSSIAGFAVTGDMALRASWGERPGFALSVGGFHPRFQPPPGFPALRRLTIPLSTGDNPRLRLEAYLALTSNTVQLGARLELYVEAAGFSLAGMLSFDALVNFAPFAFELDIAGSLTLKRGSTTLMAVEVRLNLTGPAPWHARGHATFHLLFFKVSVAFEATFGEAKPVAAPAPVAIWPLLRAALVDARDWGAELPAGAAMATVRAGDPPPGSILVHPLAQLSVRQRVVPLEREISRFANAAPADFRRFSIDAVLVGGASRAHQPTYEPFAPAAFVELNDDERLRAPGYDPMPAGATIADGGARSGPERPVPLEYETIGFGGAAPAAYAPTGATVTQIAETGAAGSAQLRRTGRARYAPGTATPTRVVEPRYAIVARDRLMPLVGAPVTDGSFSSAREAAAAFARANPRLAENVQVVRSEEILV